MITTVIKKDGNEIPWDRSKIINAIHKSSNRCKNSSITDEQINLVIEYVEDKVKEEKISTNKIHDLVIEGLSLYNSSVALEYKSFRNYKKRYSESFKNAASNSNRIVYDGDKENANKDSSLNSTKQALISESIMREFMRQFELKPEWVEAHDQGWIHIHDLPNRYLNQLNCCLFDMENLLDGGFEMNGSRYIEPKSVDTAWSVIGDITLSVSSQQYGGFSIPAIDSVLTKYAQMSYEKYLSYLQNKGIVGEQADEMAQEMTTREIEQGYQGFETKLNSVSNSLG
ncbi:anaerobic ribonucleoside-triphosphate reductase [Paraliobacillus ryukyuensis]|uniref:anaerobic ribonucleoside-triphosphate reductase n=1 Tax=Paraliobacillus ryukyuensis TaxID=200904 RepID=UPI00277B56CD|nr:anaerobic ribonucleoside-triphosphate reductase [Paraliobacillus ryukyuensis]